MFRSYVYPSIKNSDNLQERKKSAKVKYCNRDEMVSPRIEPKLSSPSSTAMAFNMLYNDNSLPNIEVKSRDFRSRHSPSHNYEIPQDIITPRSRYCSNIPDEIIFPEIFLDALKEAVTKGLLYTFLCTLTEEYMTDVLGKRGYSRDQIYWVNQSIRALTLLAGTASISQIVISPLSSFLLIKLLGMEESTANNITMGAIISLDVLTNPMGTVASLGIVAVGLGCSFFSSDLAKEIYHCQNKARDTCSEFKPFKG